MHGLKKQWHNPARQWNARWGGIKVQQKKKPIQTDPQGSYTGVPADKYEVPVQDADDL